MQLWKDGSNRINICYDSPQTQNQSTAFLILAENESIIYEYIVPYAVDEEDAIRKFLCSIRRIIEFEQLKMSPEDRQKQEWVVDRDVFERQAIQYKVEQLQQLIDKYNRWIGKVQRRSLTAFNRSDSKWIRLWSKFDQSLLDRIDKAVQEKRSMNAIANKKRVNESVEAVLLRKQYELLEMHQCGQITAHRLPAYRVIPVSYFDDSRGEVGYISGLQRLPITLPTPEWIQDDNS